MKEFSVNVDPLGKFPASSNSILAGAGKVYYTVLEAVCKRQHPSSVFPDDLLEEIDATVMPDGILRVDDTASGMQYDMYPLVMMTGDDVVTYIYQESIIAHEGWIRRIK